MNLIARIVNGTRVMTGGYLKVTPTGILIYVDEAVFPGDCYAPNGVETNGLTDNTKPWLEFDEQDWSFSEIVGPPAVPWAAYRQYRLKAELRGPWYATVNG
jgi:hypothetical protein